MFCLIGVLMVVLFFGGLFCLICYLDGIRVALFVYGLTVLITGWCFGATWLISEHCFTDNCESCQQHTTPAGSH